MDVLKNWDAVEELIAEEQERQKAARKKPEDWASRAQLAHYLTTLCTWVQAEHDEWVTQIHYDAASGTNKEYIRPRWANYEAHRRANCMRYTLSAWKAKGTEDERRRIISASYCNKRTCPYCAKRIANANEKRVSKTLEKANAAKMSRDKVGYKLLSITLTVPNCTGPELREELKNELRALRSMLRNKNALSAVVKGYVYGAEQTRNGETGLFHPHIHLIAAVNSTYGKGKDYISRKSLTELWAAYVHRDVAEAGQYIGLAKNPHQALKYTVKMSWEGWDGADAEQQDAAGENEEKPTWTGNPEWDAETMYWIETASRGLSLTGSGGVLRTKLTETAEAKEADQDDEAKHRHEWSLAGAERQGDHEEDSAETLQKELAKIMPYTDESLRETVNEALTENGEKLTGKDVDDLQKASRKQKSEAGKARAEARNEVRDRVRTKEEADAIAAAKEKERIANLMKVAMQADAVGAVDTMRRCLAEMPRWAQTETMQAITERRFGNDAES